MSTQKQVVWITGASSGIGRSMSLEWAKQGYDIVLSARRKELLEEVATEVRKHGVQALVVPMDVLEESSVKSAVETLITAFGRLDIAVANAGFGVFGTVEELSQEDWQRQFQGNVVGLAMTAKHALPHLKKTQGRLALVGSVGAFLPNPYVGAYGASKAAVHSIGLTLQVELQGTGVSCTTLHPGFVVSEIARVDNDGVWHPDRKDPRPENLMWSTDKAARVMVKAILKRKRNYVFTGHGRVAVAIQRWFPGLMRKMMAKAPKPS